MALLMSLILGSGLSAFTSSSAFAQNYGYEDDYSYNNNNNNSYSDSSYGDSYSTYPTDDKPYECRTGPFEGFFVSSVEFCKHIKFDDKKDRDNSTGTQGPPGPRGPAGPAGADGEDGAQGLPGPRGFNGTDGEDGAQGLPGLRGFNGTDGIDGVNGTDGEQGPPGITFLNGTNLYRVNSGTSSSTGATGATATASCAAVDPNDFAISGDALVLQNAGNTGIFRSEPTTPTGDGWIVTINGGSTGQPITFQAVAICYDNPPINPP